MCVIKVKPSDLLSDFDQILAENIDSALSATDSELKPISSRVFHYESQPTVNDDWGYNSVSKHTRENRGSNKRDTQQCYTKIKVLSKATADTENFSLFLGCSVQITPIRLLHV